MMFLLWWPKLEKSKTETSARKIGHENHFLENDFDFFCNFSWWKKMHFRLFLSHLLTLLSLIFHHFSVLLSWITNCPKIFCFRMKFGKCFPGGILSVWHKSIPKETLSKISDVFRLHQIILEHTQSHENSLKQISKKSSQLKTGTSLSSHRFFIRKNQQMLDG